MIIHAAGGRMLQYQQNDTIGWTQNGEVVSTDGGMIGVYDRLLEFGGKSRREQQMLVFVTVEPKKQNIEI